MAPRFSSRPARERERRARVDGLSSTRFGAVTFVQRFGSALNLNVHFHTVAPDGVFALPAPDEERPSFVGLTAPSRADVEALLARVVRRVRRCIERALEGRSDDVALEALDALAASSIESPRSLFADDLSVVRGTPNEPAPEEEEMTTTNMPTHTVFHVRDRGSDKKAHWTEVGGTSSPRRA